MAMSRKLTPCTVQIAKLDGAMEGHVVRLDIRKGGQFRVALVEITMEGFARALLGEAEVPASLISFERDD